MLEFSFNIPGGDSWWMEPELCKQRNVYISI